MEFLRDLRRYLERPPHLRPNADPDFVAHRRHLLSALDDLEQQGTGHRKIEELHAAWSKRIKVFVPELEALLYGDLGQETPREEIAKLVDVAISRSLGLQITAGSKAKDLEIDRLSKLALIEASRFEKTGQTIVQYATEIRAVKRAGTTRSITPIGKLMLDLPDRDARRWILTAEAVQSYGIADPWRLSRDSAAKLLQKTLWILEWDPEDPWPASWETLQRLDGLQVLGVADVSRNRTTVAELLPESRQLLEEIASGQSTPFVVLAEALLQDETAATLEQVRSATARIQTEGVAAGTVRHSRMVAHEIRNALVPVREALDDLYENASRTGGATFIAKYQAPIDGGIDRIFRFVKEMVNVAALATIPAEPFDITAAIDDAVAAASRDLGVTVSFPQPARLPSVLGHRGRFTLAMVNLFRNAMQARPGVEIRVSTVMSAQSDELAVTVDDNGPGVPEEHRAAIFEPGFSLRLGGSGQGLALVREVVEVEMLGHLLCEESALGGARFVLSLPVRGGTPG